MIFVQIEVNVFTFGNDSFQNLKEAIMIFSNIMGKIGLNVSAKVKVTFIIVTVELIRLSGMVPTFAIAH